MEDIYQNFNQLNDELIFDNLFKAEEWIKLTCEEGQEITDSIEIQNFITNKIHELDSFIANINVLFISKLIKKPNVHQVIKELVINVIKQDIKKTKI